MSIDQSSWIRQKQPIIRDFISERNKLLSTVSGMGHRRAPGFLYEMETSLEVGVKQKLSDVSYKILSEAIDRDVKQAGIDYDISFKVASMQWELDKQGLLAAWDQELAWIKKGWDTQDQAMDQLAIEVSKRGAVLISAKADIELQAEALRAQIAAVEYGAADYEVQLAQQKILTAQKKLLVIPILQQIIDIENKIVAEQYNVIEKEKLVVAAETDKIGYMTLLIAAQMEVAEKKQGDLFPAMQALIAKTEELTVAIREEIEYEVKIMAEKVKDAGIAVDKAEKQILILQSQLETEEVRIQITAAKIALANAQRGYELVLRMKEVAQIPAITLAEAASHTAIMNQNLGTQSNWVNLKTLMADKHLSQEVKSSNVKTNKMVETMETVAVIGYDKAIRTAEISSISELTAKLTHLIG